MDVFLWIQKESDINTRFEIRIKKTKLIKIISYTTSFIRMYRVRGHVLVTFSLANENAAAKKIRALSEPWLVDFYWVFISIEGHQDVTPNWYIQMSKRSTYSCNR